MATVTQLLSATVRGPLVAAVEAGDLSVLSGLITEQIGSARYDFQVDSVRSPGAAAAHWRLEEGRSTLSLNESVFRSDTVLIVNRLFDTLPLLDFVARNQDVFGSCLVNLGDEGHHPGLAFCDYRPDYRLIPDCIFLSGEGYADLVRHYHAAPVPWRDRRPVAFWRGASTGRRTGSVADLPRVRLCLKAVGLGARADMGLSSVVQVTGDESDEIVALGVVKGHSPIGDLNRVRYHVDIDGNSNSWPGLMAKLHSGSPVLKVESPFGFRQWYYDRLRPWENFVPLAADLEDLEDKLDYLFANEALSEAIGEAGRRLAETMTAEREIALAEPTIRDLLISNG